MRQITKTLSLPIDGRPYTFRLKKLDALSGVCLLRLLAAQTTPAPAPNAGSESHSASTPPAASRSASSPTPSSTSAPAPDLAALLFSAASEEDLRRLLIRCLENVEVLLDAGYQPVMQMGEWSWSELEYDTVSAFTLAVREIVWSLDGFFAESGPASPPGRPAS